MKPYKVKRFFPKENFLSKENAKKLRNWLTVGYTGNHIDSSMPFSRHKEIQTLLKKHPYEFKKIIGDNIKCVDKQIIIFSLACITLSGKDGKHVLNDLFLKYIKTLGDLYYFVSYIKELKNLNENITPYITKYIRNQSFEKIHKEILIYRNHITGINFSFLLKKCGLEARNEKEKLYFNYLLNPKSKCFIPIVEDYNLLKKNKQAKNIEKFCYEMLPDNNKNNLEKIVKNTNLNTILDNMEVFNTINSINFIDKFNTTYYNKYLAYKAYDKSDSAVKHVITEKFKEGKTLKKRICNIIDHDLCGLYKDDIQAKNIPFIFSQQFEITENILFETHDRFRSFNIKTESIFDNVENFSLKLRDTTTIYLDKIIGDLIEREKKVDSFIIWTYGKDFTIRKRPEILDIYRTYTGRDIKLVFVNFNNSIDICNTINDNVLNINGFDIYRTDEIIKRFIYGDI